MKITENFINCAPINTLQYSASSSLENQQGVYDQLNQLFEEKEKKQRTIAEAKEILGDSTQSLTDDQIYDLVNEIQFLTDTWIEEFEQKVFDGKTLNELLETEL